MGRFPQRKKACNLLQTHTTTLSSTNAKRMRSPADIPDRATELPFDEVRDLPLHISWVRSNTRLASTEPLEIWIRSHFPKQTARRNNFRRAHSFIAS